ncbi:hypothetical protein, partial [Paractinoplanes durhamensis]
CRAALSGDLELVAKAAAQAGVVARCRAPLPLSMRLVGSSVWSGFGVSRSAVMRQACRCSRIESGSGVAFAGPAVGLDNDVGTGSNGDRRDYGRIT